jgi:hypothetical protein
MTTGRRRVALLGAYDRFNYGDLLFPLITVRELARRGLDVETRAFSLTAADLSGHGAIPNSAMKSLYDGSFLRAGDVCIVNGGGTLGVDWTHIFMDALGPRGADILYKCERLLGRRRVDRLIRWHFGGRSCTPFIPAPADFGADVRVVYNACGGSEIQALPEALRAAAYAALQGCHYLSVRDRDVQALLQRHAPAGGVALAPDCAVLMSEHYPLEQLERDSRPALRSLLSGPYVCVQANIHFGAPHLLALRDFCEAVHRQTGLRAMLLPIGRYTGLDDHIFLGQVAAQLSTPHVVYPADASISEIMLCIARSSLFLGSSLHGNITAQSFAVPHLGLNPKSPKLKAYLDTWDIPSHRRCVDLTQSEAGLKQVAAALAAPQSDRDAKRAELTAAARGNYDRMFAAAGLPRSAALRTLSERSTAKPDEPSR